MFRATDVNLIQHEEHNQMSVLEGKVAIVTGAARGHAKAVALQFARAGAAVSICDVAPEKLQDDEVVSVIRKEGGKAMCSRTDVSKEDQVMRLVHETIEAFGTVDILANVVGIAGPTKDVWEMTLEEWSTTLAVNLDSAFLCCKAALPEMIKKRYGKIINFSSGTGKQPLSHRAPYATSKMGIIGFTRTLAADVGRYNITVNAICPGQHEERSLELTRARAAYNSEPFDDSQFRERFNRYQSDDRAVMAGTWCADEGFQEASSGPEEAAALAVFLASDAAATLTGQDINCDGGVMW